MKIGELIVWRRETEEIIGMLTNVLRIDLDDSDLLEIKTFKGETILAPKSECCLWSCPKNPGCYCGACH